MVLITLTFWEASSGSLTLSYFHLLLVSGKGIDLYPFYQKMFIQSLESISDKVSKCFKGLFCSVSNYRHLPRPDQTLMSTTLTVLPLLPRWGF